MCAIALAVAAFGIVGCGGDDDDAAPVPTVPAGAVAFYGDEFSFEPMHAPDRRIVHQAAAEVEGVRLYTVGQGLHRSVVITPDAHRGVRAERHAAEEGTAL